MEEINEKPIGVYVRLNLNSEILEVNSDIFIADLSQWIKIDEGYGDKYSHSQSQYFNNTLMDDNGNYRYKYINGKIV